MMNKYIPSNYPSLTLIRCVQGYSEPLTEEAIYTLIRQLYRDTGVRSEYLFVGHRGMNDLKNISKPGMVDINHLGQPLESHGLHVALLPTLPDGVFLVGVLDI